MSYITCKAAVAWAPRQPLCIEQIQVAPPGQREVRVKMMATSICHSDATVLNGSPICRFKLNYPVILGHEGGGIVESVGRDVTEFSPGEKVVPVSVAQCYSCHYCSNCNTNFCSSIAETQCAGLMPDSTSRFSCNGQPLFHFLGCSTFSEYTVVPEVSLCKVNEDIPLDIAGLLGCGFLTGYGSVVQSAKVSPDSVCGVWGLGAVGLSVIIALKQRKASRIIAIDPMSKKFDLAKKLGATDFINPTECPDVVGCINEMTDGLGCDFTFECVGSQETIKQALVSSNFAYGMCLINGVLPSYEEISIDPFLLLSGRTVRGAILGGMKTKDQIRKLANDYLDNKLPLDDLISQRLPFEDINKAFDLLRQGSIRTVLSFQTH